MVAVYVDDLLILDKEENLEVFAKEVHPELRSVWSITLMII